MTLTDTDPWFILPVANLPSSMTLPLASYLKDTDKHFYKMQMQKNMFVSNFNGCPLKTESRGRGLPAPPATMKSPPYFTIYIFVDS